jgi:hypothetical protein
VVLTGAGPQIEFVTATGPNRDTAKIAVFDMSTGEAVKSVNGKLYSFPLTASFASRLPT